MAASFVRYKTGLCPRMFRLLHSQSRKTDSLRLECRHLALRATSISHGVYSIRQIHYAKSNKAEASISGTGTSSVTPDQMQPALTKEESDPDYNREKYIPITRQSIIRFMIEEREFLTEEEKRLFPDFSIALDSALVNKYHHVLQELKTLFDPINPDKETLKTRETTLAEKQDSEFWLLQKLEDVMQKANFYELPKSKVKQLLSEHEVQEGIRVSVNPERYAVLRFWVLGHEKPEVQRSMWERLSDKVLKRRPRQPEEYFKRAVVAIRLKGNSKLILKSFKEVSAQKLEMLLPDGSIKISSIDKGILVTSASIAALGILAKTVTTLADINVNWMLVSSLATGAIAFRAWSMYVNKRNSYLVEVSRMLYFKNIANNRGLLAMLVDRAEDESFKEALLTYAFLLTSRPAMTRHRPDASVTLEQLGGLTESEIKETVESWIERKTGVQLDFDTAEALRLLSQLGMVSQKSGRYHVVMLPTAQCLLPQVPQSVIARSAEADLREGYDRDEYLETEEEYKAGEIKARRYGWF